MSGEVVVILGATASGKTDLAIQLAEQLGGEVVGADSRQMYRHMDIGTAKPTPQQQARVPHHLLDVVNPDETLSLAQVQALTYAAFDNIQRRARLPFLVGGTGQYLSAITEGWTIPRVPPNEALRAALEEEARQHGSAQLHARLAQLDPQAAADIHPNNARRIIRALEVGIVSGTPFSTQRAKVAPPYRFLFLGLHLPREVLYPRADARVDAMFAQGFVAEVERLLSLGYPRHLPTLSAVGYPEVIAHLLDGLPLDQAIERIKFSTHDFIRRQEIWFRKHDSGILWHNGGQIQFKAIMETLTHWIEHGDV